MYINWTANNWWNRGYQCDVCGHEADPEAHNDHWFTVVAKAAQWDVCSKDCLRRLDPSLRYQHTVEPTGGEGPQAVHPGCRLPKEK